MADQSDQKGKGRTWPEETEHEEENSEEGKEEVDDRSDEDAEGEDVDE